MEETKTKQIKYEKRLNKLKDQEIEAKIDDLTAANKRFQADNLKAAKAPLIFYNDEPQNDNLPPWNIKVPQSLKDGEAPHESATTIPIKNNDQYITKWCLL